MKIYTQSEIDKLIKSTFDLLEENGLACDMVVLNKLYQPIPIEVELHGFQKYGEPFSSQTRNAKLV